ncbi:hypothetical protein Ocin01_10164 [Orchesella cincta]|uniref:Uncharacterized protein n=1 Tax=Orchesella cincta TaxID=48709 RepID=A0A1D2MUC2_ORCCI|nr:hypothetical protein Ocin01_10164 [Orchesella cincta]
MHHFTKFHKKLWYHLALSLGSALVTVALFDTLCSLSWLCKDYQIVAHYSGEEDSSTPINFLDIAYWIFVAYRMILSLVICVGGIFMGRRIVVIVWLVVSLFIDLIHLGETIFILSKPNLMTTWPIIVAVSSCIWQELKIVRIKYRIIRRSLLVDTNNNNGDYEIEPETLQKEIQSHCDSNGRFHFEVVDTDPNGNGAGCYEMKAFLYKTEKYNESNGLSHNIATNAIHFIKLVRNLYNLLTWHITGYLFGGDYHQLISTNYKAVILEQRVIRYARVFLDALAVIYIVQV